MKLWNLKNHPKTLQKLYDNRKALMRDIGQRSRWSIGLGIVLAAAAILMLLVANWVPTDHSEYINSQTDLFSIDNIDWYTSNLQKSDCMLNADCLERSLSFEKRDLAEIDQLSNASDSTMYLYLNFWIPEVILSKLSSHPTLTVGLPRFRYEKAELFLDGESVGKFYRSERIHLTLAQSSLQKQRPLSISFVMEILPSERTISGERNHSGLIVASQGGYHAYIQYLNLKSSGAVG